jgi:hypothetical protein
VNTPDDDEDVRALLDDAVSDVEPRPGLDAIRARTAGTDRSRSTWAWAGLGAAAAVVLVLGAVTVLGKDAPTPSAGPATAGPSAAGPSSTAPSSASSSAPATTGDRAVPVYYVGETSQGPRLFREFHRATADDAFSVAADDAVRGNAADPDYRTAWPAGTTLQHAQLSDGVLSVDLGGPVRDRPAGMDAATAGLALQQLVRTVQGVAQQSTPVTFLVDGSPAASVLGVDTRQPVASTGDGALASVQVDDPLDGSTVGGSFTVRGRAEAFEANVQWELKQGDTVVKRGFTTAQECCTLSPYSFRVQGVAAGDYTLVVHDEDPSSGEGPGPSQDTKRVTVTE